MTDTTPRSHLPLLAAAQAQKHVTHNEALLMLDALGCARLLDRDLTAPPGSPADGDTYLVKAVATGDWTGQDGNIAFAVDGGWRFYAPYQGLIAYVADETKLIAYDGTAWQDLASLLTLQNVPLLGVNATADATNKLSVKSSALLFDNVGAGMQAKLNKHAASDTASLLYQTNYSGRAELGLTGDDNFHCKVSPDGASWVEAFVVDKTSGALSLAAGIKLPNGSAASPSLALNTNSGVYWDATNSGVGFALSGSQIGTLSASSLSFSTPGGGFVLSATGEASTTFQNIVFQSGANSPVYALRKGRGTIASPSVPIAGDVLGILRFGGYVSSGPTFGNTAEIGAVVSETTYGTSALGGYLRFRLAPVGSASLTEVARLDNENGLSLFGANPVIDQNRGHRLRSTTIAGAVTPSVAGNLFYHSDAQGGAGEVAVDTGAAYRHAGQAAVKRLTTDANATYAPRADGRILRDVAALTANRKLTLAATNVTDGHRMELSRRGSSGARTRDVYQADGTTLIASIADGAAADFIYDGTAALWFQK
ncbi:MAG: DUF2793 domain-containing protein [Alphaproteobacteria bacterium]|nr:DUF2793 domain-containing protein [Alphaproteobacteria bacterium]